MAAGAGAIVAGGGGTSARGSPWRRRDGRGLCGASWRAKLPQGTPDERVPDQRRPDNGRGNGLRPVRRRQGEGPADADPGAVCLGTAARAWSWRARTARASMSSVTVASVTCTPVLLRASNCTPSSRSSPVMVCDSAGWLRRSRCAAAERPLSSMTATNARISRSSMTTPGGAPAHLCCRPWFMDTFDQEAAEPEPAWTSRFRQGK